MEDNYGECISLASVSDIKLHTENLMCTNCTFSRKRRSTRSKYIYYTYMNRRSLSNVIIDSRRKIICGQQLSYAMRMIFGLKCLTDDEAQSLPMVSFASLINHHQLLIPITAGAIRVVSDTLDYHINVPLTLTFFLPFL